MKPLAGQYVEAHNNISELFQMSFGDLTSVVRASGCLRERDHYDSELGALTPLCPLVCLEMSLCLSTAVCSSLLLSRLLMKRSN